MVSSQIVPNVFVLESIPFNTAYNVKDHVQYL